MGSRYLTDLANVCRSTGLPVIEVDGWPNRSRSSGGYDSGRPSYVMLHHTASGPSSDGWPDVNYMCYSSDSKPVANLYLSRNGTIYVMAGGATNTNGKGGPVDGCPADSMNTHAIGIEAGNNGVGEPWPQAQQEAYTKLCRALGSAYGISIGHMISHAEWAPGRKIDPAGPSRWASGANTWNEDAYRGDVATGWPGGTPTPGLEASDMLTIFTVTDSPYPGYVYVSNGMNYRLNPTQQSLDALVWFMNLAGMGAQAKVQQVSKAQIGFAGGFIDTNGPTSNPYL